VNRHPLNKTVQPGYISRFRSNIAGNDKKVLGEIEDMYKNRTYWHLNKSAHSALYYTSVEERKVQVAKQRVSIPEEPTTEQMIQKLAIPALVTISCSVNFLSYIMPSFIIFLLIAFLCGASSYYLLTEHDKLQQIPAPINPASLVKPLKAYRSKYVAHLVGLPDDVAKALSNPKKRQEWDIAMSTLSESESKFIFYRTSDQSYKIVEIRNPKSKAIL
jgi:hypothetical protein